jgi:hypothetical protein
MCKKYDRQRLGLPRSPPLASTSHRAGCLDHDQPPSVANLITLGYKWYICQLSPPYCHGWWVLRCGSKCVFILRHAVPRQSPAMNACLLFRDRRPARCNAGRGSPACRARRRISGWTPVVITTRRTVQSQDRSETEAGAGEAALVNIWMAAPRLPASRTSGRTLSRL